MEKEKIILIGGGGHCISAIDVIESTGRYHIAGIIERKVKTGQTLLGRPFIGRDDDLPELVEKYSHFAITVGQMKSNAIRVKLFNLMNELNAGLPVIVSPHAYVSTYAEIGKGGMVFHGCIVNAGAKTGVGNIINTNVLIEHEAIIGNHCHISTSSTINGQAKIGDNCFIGSHSVIANNVEIGDDVIVGAGGLVLENIDEPGVYTGSPVKRIHGNE